MELPLSAPTFLEGHTFFVGKRAGGCCSAVRFRGFGVEVDVGDCDWLPPTTVGPHVYTPVAGSRLGATCVSHVWINDSSSFTPLMWKNLEKFDFCQSNVAVGNPLDFPTVNLNCVYA